MSLGNSNFENFSTCVTIIQDSLDDLNTAILQCINSNFVQRHNLLHIERKCPKIEFSAGTNSIVVSLRNGDYLIKLTDIEYNYDVSNIYLSYGANPYRNNSSIEETDFNNTSQNENILKYSVVICFTITSTISGFSIISPSNLISNSDNTFSISNTISNGDSIYSYSQNIDSYMTYEDILNRAYNPNTIDFNNLYIRNKLLSNPNCYYELSYTDLINKDSNDYYPIYNLPYIVDKFYEINTVNESTPIDYTFDTYSICSVLKTTQISYRIDEYPVLFPKSIINSDNTIKGYLNYVFDIPTQILDTGDSINNLYSGQLINLEDSQYIICDANTVIQLENIVITGDNVNSVYNGRYQTFDIMFPIDDNVKVFTTLTSAPTLNNSLYSYDSEEAEKEQKYNSVIVSPVSEAIHSWFPYKKSLSSGETRNIEYSCVDAGNYDFVYKVCVLNTDLQSETEYNYREYLRLHKLCRVNADNEAVIPKFANYNTIDQYDGYLTSYTSKSSIIKPNENYSIKITLDLVEIIAPNPSVYPDKESYANFTVELKPDTEVNRIEIEVTKDNVDSGNSNIYYIKTDTNEILGSIVFTKINSMSTKEVYNAEIRLYNGLRSKNDKLFYNINETFYTVKDLVYIEYKYIPDVYIEYYGYTNVYLDRTDLVGYYVNTDSIFNYNEADDPVHNKPKYALEYYFATNSENRPIYNNMMLYMAKDKNGEPDEWTKIMPIYKAGETHLSIGPQYSFGYPNYRTDGNVDTDSTSITEIIWYKLECRNYNTIIDSGTVTINDLPIITPQTESSEAEQIIDTNDALENDANALNFVSVEDKLDAHDAQSIPRPWVEG